MKASAVQPGYDLKSPDSHMHTKRSRKKNKNQHHIELKVNALVMKLIYAIPHSKREHDERDNGESSFNHPKSMHKVINQPIRKR